MVILVSSTLPHLSTPALSFCSDLPSETGYYRIACGVHGAPHETLLRPQFTKLSETAGRLWSPGVAGHSPSWNQRSCHYPQKTLRRSGLSTLPYRGAGIRLVSDIPAIQSLFWSCPMQVTLLPMQVDMEDDRLTVLTHCLPGALWCAFQPYSSTLGWCNCMSNQSPICYPNIFIGSPSWNSMVFFLWFDNVPFGKKTSVHAYS